ncbi:MAG: hypothetical protein JNG88_00115 [Phycisphaerales bacterium]|nr:hypothetical protein [Phycisphaerales bacterium]
MDIAVRVKAIEHPSFIRGRCAEISLEDGRALGVMGELHPQVIENYGLKHAVAVLEIDLREG